MEKVLHRKVNSFRRRTAVSGDNQVRGFFNHLLKIFGVRIDQITYEIAPSNPQLYANLAFGQFQGTGGSTAMANSFMQYRTAGAAAREMLISTAAGEWGVDAGSLTIEEGIIKGAGNEAPIGSFVEAASMLAAPEQPRLKSPEEFQLIGNPDIRRLDSAIKSDGTAKFAIDVFLPDQMVVVISRPPRLNGEEFV